MNVSRPYERRHRLRVQFPKRQPSPLRRACPSLGLDVDAQPETNLALILHKAKLGKTGMDYLRWSEDEHARQIVARYDSLNATERKAVTIDYLIMATGVEVHHVWGMIQVELSRMDGLTGSIAASVNAVKVLKMTIENALKPGGHEDRKLFFQLSGQLPHLRSQVSRDSIASAVADFWRCGPLDVRQTNDTGSSQSYRVVRL